MSRKSLVEDEVLIARLGDVFREAGYEGASLALLSGAAGLRKASLYHRFPGGKEQMANEVLGAAGRWLDENILTPLTGDGTPRQRIEAMISQIDIFYRGGEQACLLNLLSAPVCATGPFQAVISEMFEAFISVLARVVEEAGYSGQDARDRAERAVASIQGSLVLARGLGTSAPFSRMLRRLPAELLGVSV